MAHITLTNETNSPIRIDTTLFGVEVPTSAALVGTDLQIAEIYRDAGLGTLTEGTPPSFAVYPWISMDGSDIRVDAAWDGDPVPTVTYEWYNSETEDGTYTIILGEDQEEWSDPPVGWYKTKVTLTNIYGSTDHTSEPFEVED